MERLRDRVVFVTGASLEVAAGVSVGADGSLDVAGTLQAGFLDADRSRPETEVDPAGLN